MKPIIIVLEDELVIAKDIQGILEDEGYEVIINVVTVEHAIRLIEEVHPVLILLDINLRQDKDGIFLGQYLLVKDNIPYIYISSNADKTTLDRVNDTRPYGYIVKPFKPIDIKTTVSIVLNNYKHRNIDLVRAGDPLVDDVPFIIKKTITYINENIFEKIAIATLSEITRWKPHHFIRVFTKHTGITPYQYILNRKINKAQTMLVETKIPIVEIAYDLGFQSHGNFCNAFKKIIKQTPEAFRKSHNIKSYL